MKIYEAWDELKEWLSSRQDFWYGRNDPARARVFGTILNKMDELEMKHE